MPKRPGQRRAAETIKFSAEEALDFARQTKRCAALLVVQGAELDLGTHVICDRPITIGRDLDVELPLRDGSTSRRHCRIERDGETGPYVVRDLGSTNGTRVNGLPVSGTKVLAEGDKVFLGTTVVRFSYSDGFDVDYQARVENMVGTDPLTGLASQRRFDAEHALALGKARVDSSPLCVLVMDMDGLKQINDAHGHDMGGFAIAETANVLRAIIDARGAACRFGGDEFMAYLSGHDKSAGQRVGEQICVAVAAHHYEKDGIVIRPTISIGVASYPDDGETVEELFRAGDRALYRAKAAGRNRVSL